MTDLPAPLEGIRVLDIATFIAAPFAAAALGEFGAEVIKIEKPGVGDSLRGLGTPSPAGDSYNWLNEARNKKCVTLDLRHPKGAELFKRMVAESDVVVENFRPGTLEKWGLGYDVLSKVNEGLILLRVSGYGQTGPKRSLPGFARIAHAFCGLTYLTGQPDTPPLMPGSTTLADYLTGIYGAYGILLALRVKERTGQGLLRVYTGDKVSKELQQMSDGEGLEILAGELISTFPSMKGKIVTSSIKHWLHAISPWRLGRLEIAEDIKAPTGRIHYCGDYTVSGGLEAAVLSAQRVLDELTKEPVN